MEFEFNFPKEVEIDKRFSVSLSTQENLNENYDVKIFVHTAKEEKIPRSTYISEIYNEEKNEWSDPWFYIKNSFPKETEYKIKIFESPGEQTICARLRLNDLFEEKCEKITVEKSDEEPEKSSEKRDLVYYSNSPKEEINLSQSIKNSEKIKLSPKTEKEIIQTHLFTKRKILTYSFVIFLFILLILLALRRL